MSHDFVEAKNVDSSAAVRGYRSTRGLTTAILIMLGIHALISVFVCFGVQAMLRIEDALRSGAIDRGDFNLGDSFVWLAVNVGDWLQTGLFIATAVCFLCWIYRGYSNLPALGSERLTTPKSAVVGWLIPFVNLVHGYRSTHELYLESQRPAVLPSGYILPTRASIVGWWWGIYISRNFSIRIANSGLNNGRDGSLFWFWLAAGLDIAAAILCMMVVYRIDRRQRDQHQDLVRRAQEPVPTGDSLR
jgi:hypothetical protein